MTPSFARVGNLSFLCKHKGSTHWPIQPFITCRHVVPPMAWLSPPAYSQSPAATTPCSSEPPLWLPNKPPGLVTVSLCLFLPGSQTHLETNSKPCCPASFPPTTTPLQGALGPPLKSNIWPPVCVAFLLPHHPASTPPPWPLALSSCSSGNLAFSQ